MARAGLEPGNAVLRVQCCDHSPCVGMGGGGCTFLKSPILVPLKRLVFVTRKPGKWEVEACGFLFFSGGGVGSKRYVCMYAVAGEPSKEGVCYRA